MKRLWNCRPVRWLRARPIAIGMAVLAVGVILSLQIDRVQDLNEREDDRREAEEAQVREREHRIEAFVDKAVADCRTGNQTRELIRDIGVELSIASAAGNAEALITVVPDADPEVVEQFRQLAVDNAQVNAEVIVAQLTDRDCEQVAVAARAEAENP